ncbi:MAG: hypothetical protein A2847_02215 [Candidatus Sungbacteria bacterium RIFCSPHIGHO2_01_FULL_50_25]|uniref:Uncharacterized protein n=1 Tax=Candidatus Sungbacteria bacterium RIFCSPHIGHO2_01_FULL_50_25 TaxID=1802265 RepID=A0A1G2K6B7_9BACT|nr:MAG: hypothetical protein A2847_02215 [Candidatus Sungbacteria bacterium RIFCSPHIGHO2_01_FULL_50_25]
MTSFLRRHRHFFSTAVFLAAIIGILFYVEPIKIIAAIGVKNMYVAVFLFAIVGGVSAFTATSFYASLFAFALGGGDPLFLAIFSAPGVLIGDYLFWYLGHKGKPIVKPAIEHILERTSRWLSAKPAWFIPAAAYVYTGFVPLPGEFLMVTLALIGISFKRIFIPTLFGNFTLAFIVSSSASYGISIFGFL